MYSIKCFSNFLFDYNSNKALFPSKGKGHDDDDDNSNKSNNDKINKSFVTIDGLAHLDYHSYFLDHREIPQAGNDIRRTLKGLP